MIRFYIRIYFIPDYILYFVSDIVLCQLKYTDRRLHDKGEGVLLHDVIGHKPK